MATTTWTMLRVVANGGACMNALQDGLLRIVGRLRFTRVVLAA